MDSFPFFFPGQKTSTSNRRRLPPTRRRLPPNPRRAPSNRRRVPSSRRQVTLQPPSVGGDPLHQKQPINATSSSPVGLASTNPDARGGGGGAGMRLKCEDDASSLPPSQAHRFVGRGGVQAHEGELSVSAGGALVDVPWGGRAFN